MRLMKTAAWMVLVAGFAARADDYQPIPDDRLEGISKALVELAGKVKDAPAKIELNAAKARGLFDQGNNRGVVVIPGKDLKEDRDNPELSKEMGRPIGGIFFHNALPTGSTDKNKLFKLDLKDAEGVEREVRFAVVTVRKKSDDQYFLQIWGSEKQPLVEAQIGEAEGDDKMPVDISVDGGELIVKLLGKYGTRLGIKESKF